MIKRRTTLYSTSWCVPIYYGNYTNFISFFSVPPLSESWTIPPLSKGICFMFWGRRLSAVNDRRIFVENSPARQHFFALECYAIWPSLNYAVMLWLSWLTIGHGKFSWNRKFQRLYRGYRGWLRVAYLSWQYKLYFTNAKSYFNYTNIIKTH